MSSTLPNKVFKDRSYFLWNAKLSDREQYVATKIAMGWTTGQIADEIGVSRKTTVTFRRRILDKFGFDDEREFIPLVWRAGLVK